MTATLDPLDAEEIYTAALEARQRGLPVRLVLGALDLWCAMTGGRMELTRSCDLVVRRRSDGVAELRIAVPVADDAPAWLAMVREDLVTLEPAAFRDRWGIE